MGRSRNTSSSPPHTFSHTVQSLARNDARVRQGRRHCRSTEWVRPFLRRDPKTVIGTSQQYSSMSIVSHPSNNKPSAAYDLACICPPATREEAVAVQRCMSASNHRNAAQRRTHAQSERTSGSQQCSMEVEGRYCGTW